MCRRPSIISRVLLAVTTAGLTACNDPAWKTNWGAQSPKAEAQPDAQPASDSWAAPGEAFTSQGSDVLESDQSATPAGGNPTLDDRGAYVLRVHFDVCRVDLPVGDIRHSRKIWNHLEESRGDPGLTALLARNGFRAGVGDQADWPALRAIFEHNRARVTRVALTVQDGAPLSIPLGPVADGTSYFLHRRGGGLSGGNFDAGQRTIRLEYGLDSDDPRRVLLRALPAFQRSQTSAKTVERDGALVVVRDHEGRIFRELAADVVLTEGQFLVIGGSEPASAGFLLGSCWLDSSLDMQPYETVLCISARATRIE